MVSAAIRDVTERRQVEQALARARSHCSGADRDATSRTTDRLLLRAFRASDLAAVHAYASDPAVVRFMDWGPNAMAETRAYVDRILALIRGEWRDRLLWAVLRDRRA
jgi:RimJ/RimL family protein N-acetyltransferase